MLLVIISPKHCFLPSFGLWYGLIRSDPLFVCVTQCTSTKNLFKDMGVDAKVIELDAIDNGSQIQAALLDLSGQRTVPNVFIKGQHLGGNDNTQAAARTGKLQKMLGK